MSYSMQLFQIGFFHIIIFIQVSSMTFHGLIAHFLLSLNNISLSGCTTVYLSIHFLKDILVDSKFWQLWIKLLKKKKTAVKNLFCIFCIIMSALFQVIYSIILIDKIVFSSWFWWVHYLALLWILYEVLFLAYIKFKYTVVCGQVQCSGTSFYSLSVYQDSNFLDLITYLD